MSKRSLSVPIDAASFRPRFPWLGGDLQTLHNFLTRPQHGLDKWPGERLELAMRDGSGDRLVARLQRPGEGRYPLVVLIHGLTGCEDSIYVRGSAAFWLARGYAVVRLNLRGAGPSRPLCGDQYHAGRSADLRDVLLALLGVPSVNFDAGLFLVGYSLGANILLRFLAEEAKAYPVVAAMSVSAPIDLKAAQQRLMNARNWVYHRYLLGRMREEALATPRKLSAAERAAIVGADSVLAFDERVVAPRNGFGGAGDYYRQCSGQRFLPAITTPTLLVHAKDDPWIPSLAYEEVDWSAHPALSLQLTTAGGHVGFHDRGSMPAWYDLAAEAFFDEKLQST